MAPAPATLAELGVALRKVAPDTPVAFDAPTGRADKGYHVTELKLAEIQSIDCGGRKSAWSEVQLQVLNSMTGNAMRAGKLAGIIEKSQEAIEGLATAPLAVEFAPDNQALTRYRLGASGKQNKEFVVTLENEGAVCKPALDYMARTGQTCCG